MKTTPQMVRGVGTKACDSLHDTMKEVVGRVRIAGGAVESRVEVIPELERKEVLARQKADAL